MNTESRNPNTMHIDRMSTAEMIHAIQVENINAAKAVGDAEAEITEAVDYIFDRMKDGGRLIYVGCGTSGRLGVLDASECPPTFGVPESLVVGVMAGGAEALVRSVAKPEDRPEEGAHDVSELSLTPLDSVVGISASGNAPYVRGALERARELGCGTVSLASNRECAIHAVAEKNITVVTGAEVVSGSTRMKAGTAQKLVLNMLSTSLMIKLGHVYENLMINLEPRNDKLTRRMISIVRELSGADADAAKKALDENGWKIRPAVDALKEGAI